MKNGIRLWLYFLHLVDTSVEIGGRIWLVKCFTDRVNKCRNRQRLLSRPAGGG